VLINFSNHPYEKWSKKQKRAAQEYGNTIDLPFPPVPGNADEKDIEILCEKAVQDILEMINDDPETTVMVQGEYTLTYSVVKKLSDRGIRVLASSSERLVNETYDNGKIFKHIEFRFERFREYR